MSELPLDKRIAEFLAAHHVRKLESESVLLHPVCAHRHRRRARIHRAVGHSRIRCPVRSSGAAYSAR